MDRAGSERNYRVRPNVSNVDEVERPRFQSLAGGSLMSAPRDTAEQSPAFDGGIAAYGEGRFGPISLEGTYRLIGSNAGENEGGGSFVKNGKAAVVAGGIEAQGGANSFSLYSVSCGSE